MAVAAAKPPLCEPAPTWWRDPVSKAFGGSPEVWLGMQMDYDLAQALKKAAGIKVKPVPEPAAA